MTDKKNDLKKVLNFCRSSFLYVGLFSFFINLLMLVPPLYMLQVYDRVITTRSEETLLMLTLVVVFLFMVMGALELLRSRIMVRVSNKLDTLISPRLYSAMFKRSLMMPGRPSAQPLNDLRALRQYLSGNSLFAFFDAPWVPVYIGVLFLFHPWLGWFAMGAGVILGIIALINEWLTRSLLGDASSQHVASQNLANSNIRNAEVLHAMGMLPGIQNRWDAHHHEYLLLQSRANDRSGLLTSLSKTLRLLFQSLILGLGAWLVLSSDITPGMMIAGSILMGRALAPLDQMINGWKGTAAARTARARLEELVTTIPEDVPGMPLPPPTGQLNLEGVNAAPPGVRLPTLKNINLSLKKGEQIALTGASAAGKSTLARVMLGIWPSLLGSVRLDGADISQWDRVELGPSIGYLPQDIELFDGPVSDNIARFGDLDSEAVSDAARQAGVDDIIRRLPNGYNTWLSHGGTALSAGQRQSIGLARALYGKPVLVVLDEPDANLDDEGELALAECLNRLRQQGTTVVVITHRRRLLSQVDRIIKLSDGQIVDSITPDQLPHVTLIQSRPSAPRPATSVPDAQDHDKPSTPSEGAQ